jgi:DNA invertase Pin-like site-specific DNA recombinase
MKRVALYCRVSTKEQTVENQLLDLREYCKLRQWDITHEFTDHGVSGAKEIRPQLTELMKMAKKRKLDVVLVWRFDRFARSLKHLINALAEFNFYGIDFVSYQDGIDTTSPAGKLQFQIVGAFSEFERDIIRERVKSGLRRAVEAGIRLGRPNVSWDVDKAQEMRARGVSLRSIAAELGVSKSLVAQACPLKVREKGALIPSRSGN